MGAEVLEHRTGAKPCRGDGAVWGVGAKRDGGGLGGAKAGVSASKGEHRRW